MQQTLAGHVSAELRAELARRELTNKQFAEMLGVTEMWVSRKTRGQSAISLDDLQRIADALGLPTSFFTERAA